MPRYVINPKSSATISFAATEAELGTITGTDATFQVTSFKITHSPQTVTVPATYGAGASDDMGMAKYTLDLEYLQDWGLNAASFAAYLWEHEGETVFFEIEPIGDVAAVDGMTGRCVLPGADYGGPADETWIATVSCPCVEKPTLVSIDLAAADVDVDDDV